MKKMIAFCIGVMITTCVVNKVQAQAYEQGSSVIQATVGLGGGLGMPIGLAYDYGLKERISLGGYVGYASKTVNYGFFDASFTYILVGARGNYHFDAGDRFDPYVGVLLGYNAASVSTSNGGVLAAGGGVAYGGQLGARYFLTDNLAAVGELGYGIGYLTLGLAYKL